MSRIAVIGAGIVGSASATWLVAQGHDVSVFDADPDGLPTSSGNASLIALPEIAPLASPGVLAAVPGWLLDPLGPLALRWPDLPALVPWLLAFLASATPSRGQHVRQALAGLMRTTLADHEAMAAVAGITGHLRQSGYLSVHANQRGVAAAADEARRVNSVLGLDFEVLDAAAARRHVPPLEGEFAGAVYQPGYWMATNPLTVLRQYQTFLRQRARLLAGRVRAIEPQASGVAVSLESGETQSFDQVVVAAGVWSRDLVRRLGLKVLLETERGYNTTFSDLGWNLPMPVGFSDHGFVATPLVDGLRVGGAVELAKPDTPPNYKRAAGMRAKMRAYVPSLPEGGAEWMGRRPSTPDSLPVISRHPGDRRVLFAFGHGHLGLTLSATTGRLIAEMAAGGEERPEFSISRFQHRVRPAA
ncbi:NAD(P)/FAD-dependent oxidoreductase [Devosia sp. CN2-171]|uniref:NAD(P)/FAD-dependent oxidoreductase n=1 Tax=Devosia sp. CN2-171 TaxID=3400909 RepID=UPI003BF7B693